MDKQFSGPATRFQKRPPQSTKLPDYARTGGLFASSMHARAIVWDTITIGLCSESGSRRADVQCLEVAGCTSATKRRGKQAVSIGQKLAWPTVRLVFFSSFVVPMSSSWLRRIVQRSDVSRELSPLDDVQKAWRERSSEIGAGWKEPPTEQQENAKARKKTMKFSEWQALHVIDNQ